MYLCSLKLLVLSSSQSTAEALAALLRDAQPIEDCEYQVEASSFGSSHELGVDSAVILDGDSEQLCKYERRCGERVVLLTTASAIASLGADALAAADDLWVMPDHAPHDKDRLRIYNAKLLQTMKERSDARKAEICFRTVIDSLPDLVWFKNNDGAHLIVNDQFCGVVEKTKQQIYKQGHNYIWDVPAGDTKSEAVCRQSEDVVVKARKTLQFEENITIKGNGMRQLVTYKSPLIDVDGSIFGTCGMGHDITDLRNVTKELVIILDSIPFGVAICDPSDKILATNKFMQKFFPNAEKSIGQSFEAWNNGLPKEKISSDQDEDEYRLTLHGQERIVRFREEPIVDIFGENVGNLHFIRDTTIQYNFEQQNIKHANTDFLTGLNNRRSLFDHLNALSPNTKLSLIMMDLDKFKSVNDTYGHAAGDEALEITARTLEDCFPDGFIARLGGDEFLVALAGELDLPQVEQRTQHLLDALVEKFSVQNEFRTLSASAGIAQDRLPLCDMKSIEQLISRSDAALYDAKNAGKARYCVRS
jgi:diguanylate cyclase (GGDEF)-like protein